jgi:ubiquinone biosynthesis protein Coq4
MRALSKLRYNLESLYALVMLGRRTDDVRYVFMIGNAQDNLAEPARANGRMRDPFRNPSLERMWQQQYCPERYGIDELMGLSPRTLGGAYARHMAERGLRPDFYDDVAPRHKLHYLRLRLRLRQTTISGMCSPGSIPTRSANLDCRAFTSARS